MYGLAVTLTSLSLMTSLSRRRLHVHQTLPLTAAEVSTHAFPNSLPGQQPGDVPVLHDASTIHHPYRIQDAGTVGL